MARKRDNIWLIVFMVGVFLTFTGAASYGKCDGTTECYAALGILFFGIVIIVAALRKI